MRVKGTMEVLGDVRLLCGIVVSLSAVWAEQEEGEFIRDMVDAVYRDYRPFSDMIFPFHRWHEAPSREPVATDTGI